MSLVEIVKNVFSMNFLLMTLRLATPLFFASMSSFIAGITGIGNIAIESIMTMSSLFAILGSYWSQSAFVGFLVGLLMGILMAVIIAFFSMRLGASAQLVGIALNTFSGSLATFFLYLATNNKGTSASLLSPGFGTWTIPVIKDIPVIGQILSGQYILTYVGWVLLVVLFILVFKTPLGMRMRACGLNPDAAKTAGVKVERLQLLSLVFSGFFAALGGIYLSLNYMGLYSSGMVSGQGWMGIAANGISGGNYLALILASLAFAAFRAVSVVFVGTEFPSELIGALPYIVVFVGIVMISIINYYKVKKGNVAEK